jgi:homoserine dehydrogenase
MPATLGHIESNGTSIASTARPVGPGVPLRSRPQAGGIRTIHVGLLGLGRVGQAFARLCRAQRDTLRDCGLELRVSRALVRDGRKDRGDIGRRTLVTDERATFLAATYDVVVEALGGVEPARELIDALLAAGTPVVTANKSLVAAHGPALRRRPCAARPPRWRVFHCSARSPAGRWPRRSSDCPALSTALRATS